MGIGSRCADPVDLPTLELCMGSKRGRGYKQYNPVYKQYNPANLPTLDTTYGVQVAIFEHTCACAQWAHMHRFLSGCLSLDQNSSD